MTGPVALFDRGFAYLEKALDRVFTPMANPLRLLGALGWFVFRIVVVRRVYL